MSDALLHFPERTPAHLRPVPIYQPLEVGRCETQSRGPVNDPLYIACGFGALILGFGFSYAIYLLIGATK